MSSDHEAQIICVKCQVGVVKPETGICNNCFMDFSFRDVKPAMHHMIQIESHQFSVDEDEHWEEVQGVIQRLTSDVRILISKNGNNYNKLVQPIQELFEAYNFSQLKFDSFTLSKLIPLRFLLASIGFNGTEKQYEVLMSVGMSDDYLFAPLSRVLRRMAIDCPAKATVSTIPDDDDPRYVALRGHVTELNSILDDIRNTKLVDLTNDQEVLFNKAAYNIRSILVLYRNIGPVSILPEMAHAVYVAVCLDAHFASMILDLYVGIGCYSHWFVDPLIDISKMCLRYDISSRSWYDPKRVLPTLMQSRKTIYNEDLLRSSTECAARLGVLAAEAEKLKEQMEKIEKEKQKLAKQYEASKAARGRIPTDDDVRRYCLFDYKEEKPHEEEEEEKETIQADSESEPEPDNESCNNESEEEVEEEETKEQPSLLPPHKKKNINKKRLADMLNKANGITLVNRSTCGGKVAPNPNPHVTLIYHEEFDETKGFIDNPDGLRPDAEVTPLMTSSQFNLPTDGRPVTLQNLFSAFMLYHANSRTVRKHHVALMNDKDDSPVLVFTRDFSTTRLTNRAVYHMWWLKTNSGHATPTPQVFLKVNHTLTCPILHFRDVACVSRTWLNSTKRGTIKFARYMLRDLTLYIRCSPQMDGKGQVKGYLYTAMSETERESFLQVHGIDWHEDEYGLTVPGEPGTKRQTKRKRTKCKDESDHSAEDDDDNDNDDNNKKKKRKLERDRTPVRASAKQSVEKNRKLLKKESIQTQLDDAEAHISYHPSAMFKNQIFLTLKYAHTIYKPGHKDASDSKGDEKCIYFKDGANVNDLKAFLLYNHGNSWNYCCILPVVEDQSGSSIFYSNPLKNEQRLINRTIYHAWRVSEKSVPIVVRIPRTPSVVFSVVIDSAGMKSIQDVVHLIRERFLPDRSLLDNQQHIWFEGVDGDVFTAEKFDEYCMPGIQDQTKRIIIQVEAKVHFKSTFLDNVEL